MCEVAKSLKSTTTQVIATYHEVHTANVSIVSLKFLNPGDFQLYQEVLDVGAVH